MQSAQRTHASTRKQPAQPLRSRPRPERSACIELANAGNIAKNVMRAARLSDLIEIDEELILFNAKYKGNSTTEAL